MSSKFNRFAMGALLTVLTAVVGVQSYLLFQVHRDLGALPEPARARSADEQAGRSPRNLAHRSSGALADPADPLVADPFGAMRDMQSRIDDLFERSLRDFDLDHPLAPSAVPRADLSEDGDEYVVRVDVPGADESSFEVSLDDRSLTVEGARSDDIREEGPGRVLRQERRVGRFERRFALPGPVDPGSLTSDYADGVLTVRVRKA